MKCYFHCDANIYRKKVRTFLEYTAVPVVVIAVFMTVCLLLSLRNLMNGRILFPAVASIGGVLFAFALITRVMLEIAEHRVRVHSKYTYVEVALKYVIVSLYGGSYFHKRKRVVFRRIFVIPYSQLISAQTVKDKIRIRAEEGAIREYNGNSDRLGYYFKDGEIIFREFLYNERGFSLKSEILIPKRFSDNDEIVESVLVAKERFGLLPTPKSYVFEEMAFVKTKKMRDLSKKIRDA
ncbi:MAG: hypothetical protein FWG83_07530 [Oscillospiraceae bacterium]|nr:hypothetical protein [Oscillospiraceae bacterium]